MKSKKMLLLSLLFPILLLAGLTFRKQSVKSFGQTLVLPISGFDPRDLLSGHYLVYRIDYGFDVCRTLSSKKTKDKFVFVCPKEQRVESFPPSSCQIAIRGTCFGSQFRAGVERYYVPEDEALRLEKLVQAGNASILLSVSKDGKAVVKDLLIEGRRWQELENK